MAAQRKRKHAVAEEQPCQRAAGGQHGIKAFGIIGKAHDASNEQKKRKMAHAREPPPPKMPGETNQSSTKRKRASDSDDADNIGQDALKQDPMQTAATTPNKRSKQTETPTPAETPSKCAADLFRKMKLEKASAPIPFALNTARFGYETPPSTPDAHLDEANQLPPQLNDLLLQHSAFLSALSMYFAHNGTSSSVDVKALLPMITKHWKKRSVSVDDLRILLAVEQQEAPDLVLKDFGRAGLRLLKPVPRGRTIKRCASYIDEANLSARFQDALQDRWSKWSDITPKEDRLPSMFLDQLPLAEIDKDTSVEQAAPVFARGQQRLADMKATQADPSMGSSKISSVSSDQQLVAAVQNRGTNLLDRILAKQALSSTLPAGPTRDQIERKAALQRIEDVARVLDLLAAGRSRCSFSMQGLSQQVRQSLRNPISKEEIERCLALMADEITPDFVGLVRNGTVTGVVITKSGKVGLDELRQRVKVACEALPSRL